MYMSWQSISCGCSLKWLYCCYLLKPWWFCCFFWSWTSISQQSCGISDVTGGRPSGEVGNGTIIGVGITTGIFEWSSWSLAHINHPNLKFWVIRCSTFHIFGLHLSKADRTVGHLVWEFGDVIICEFGLVELVNAIAENIRTFTSIPKFWSGHDRIEMIEKSSNYAAWVLFNALMVANDI